MDDSSVELPVTSMTINQALVDSYIAAVGHRTEAGMPGRTVPPSVAGIILYQMLSRMAETDGVVLVGQGYRMHRPIEIGDHLTTSGFALTRRDHKNRAAMRIDTRTFGEDGDLVMTGWIRRLLPKVER